MKSSENAYAPAWMPRPSVHRGQERGLSGRDGDAVNEQFADFLHEGRC
jgi:hypothetical protein